MTEQHQPRFYHGHRANSFIPQDVNEIVEIRARQRTFDGAYGRSALGNLGYALTILRLFDKRFFKIGIVYTILAALLYLMAFWRNRHSAHDFADKYRRPSVNRKMHALPTVGQTGKQIFGRPFVTAGWIVLAVTVIVALVEIGLLILIFQI